jgi:hypothetical protein
VAFSVGDVRRAHAQHGGGFDVVLSADNALPHLLTDADLRLALGQMRACLRPGGACLISLRDYAHEPRGRHLFKPYGVREDAQQRTVLFQIWDFDDDGERYDLSLFVVEEDRATGQARSQVMHSRYYAMSIAHVMALMREAGFHDVQRLDQVFFQPVLVGTRLA